MLFGKYSVYMPNVSLLLKQSGIGHISIEKVPLNTTYDVLKEIKFRKKW